LIAAKTRDFKANNRDHFGDTSVAWKRHAAEDECRQEKSQPDAGRNAGNWF
jgi:hypothetical protein